MKLGFKESKKPPFPPGIAAFLLVTQSAINLIVEIGVLLRRSPQRCCDRRNNVVVGDTTVLL